MATADHQPVDTRQSKDDSAGLLRVSYTDYKRDCIPPQWVATIMLSPDTLLAWKQHQEDQVGRTLPAEPVPKSSPLSKPQAEQNVVRPHSASASPGLSPDLRNSTGSCALPFRAFSASEGVCRARCFLQTEQAPLHLPAPAVSHLMEVY